jgi:regulator of protease activity HflC (stomatin/prohibitin superfamily)
VAHDRVFRYPKPVGGGEGGREMEQLDLILAGIVALVALYLIFTSFFTVNTAQVAVITRLGKSLRVAEPGLNWKRPV